MCSDFLYNFLILRITHARTVINVHGSSRKVHVILVRFQSHLDFLDRFSKNTQIRIFMKVRPVGAELFHVYGRTDTKKPIVDCRNFANEPEIE